METTPNSKLKNIKSFFQSTGYPKKFRKDVHILLNFGYQQSRTSLNAKTQEPTITGRIAEEIEKGLEELDLLPESVLKPHYVVIPENSRIKSTDTNNIKDKFIRLDIVILDNRKRPYRRYVIEGKRLKKKNFSEAVDKYCNIGIKNFIDEIYASDSPEAILVGFWQDENARHWFDEIIQNFTDNEKALSVQDRLIVVKVIPEITDELVSSHQRKSGSKIILFHILLDCQ